MLARHHLPSFQIPGYLDSTSYKATWNKATEIKIARYSTRELSPREESKEGMEKRECEMEFSKVGLIHSINNYRTYVPGTV